MLCLTCMISLCACQKTHVNKNLLRVYADASLDKKLQLVGDKFLVTDGKEYDIQYTFDTPENLLEKLRAGEPCDLVITSSESLLHELEENHAISSDHTIELMTSPLAMITSEEAPSFPLDMDSLFYRTDYVEEDYYEEETIEGYRLYTDVLWEITSEEEWQEDWNEQYDGLWIRESVPVIGLLSIEHKERQIAKDLLNQNGQAFDLLNQIGKIRYYDSKDSLLEAVRDREVQIGLCSLIHTIDEKNIQTLKVYDNPDLKESFYMSLINSSENRKDAKVFMNFLQGDHAKRFFEDFGFKLVR